MNERATRRAKIGEFEGEVIGLREARRRARGRAIVAIARSRAEFYALRDIAPGEELTVDYMDSHHNGRLPCRCGANGCRGFI